jgi:hypothetical protein
MKKNILLKVALVFLFIVIGYGLRSIPSLPNFSPFFAIALFAGIIFPKNKLAFALPLGIQLTMDLTVGLYSYTFTDVMIHIITMYVGLAAFSLIGQKSSNNINFPKTILGISLGNIIFFLLTNFGSWIQMPNYSADIYGLMNSYMAGLPFLKNAMLSGLIFTSIFYPIYRLAEKRNEAIELSK